MQSTASSYYYYKVYSSNNGSITVAIVDEELKSYELAFRTNQTNTQLYFRAAYYKYIVIEERNDTNNSVGYWVLSIV